MSFRVKEEEQGKKLFEKPQAEFSLGNYLGRVMESMNASKAAVAAQVNAAYDRLISAAASQKGQITKQADESFREIYGNAKASAFRQEEQLASLGLGKGNGRAPSSGYGESSRIRQDAAMRNNLASAAGTRDRALAETDRQISGYDAQRAQKLADLESQYGMKGLDLMRDAAQMEFNYYTWQKEFDYGREQDALAQANWQSRFDYDRKQDALAQDNWQSRFEYDREQDALAQDNWQSRFDYDRMQDELAQENWKKKFDYDRAQDELAQENWEKKFNYDRAQDALAQANWEKSYLLRLAGKGGGSGGSGGGDGKDEPEEEKRLSDAEQEKYAGEYDPQEAKFKEYLRFAQSRASFSDGEDYAAYFDQLYRQTSITEEQYVRALRERGYSDRVIRLRLSWL